MIRTRKEVDANYSSVFINGKTIRIPLNPQKEITELKSPEFYDVAINSRCYGSCPYCYTSATSKGTNFENVIEKINSYFGGMELNERPYQIAAGGAGEPTLHPEFLEVCKTFKNLDIVPNYTTNGMHMTDNVLEATLKYCGGVAVTCHPHLTKHWSSALNKLIQNNIKTNVHLVISDKESIDNIKKIHKQYLGKIDYYVLLPYMNYGFASNDPKTIDYDYLEKFLDDNKFENIAFGANFYEFLKRTKKWDVSLYPPEIMSKYLIMDDNMFLYRSSFDTKTPISDYHREKYLQPL